jgi:hypothetical protein
MALDSAQVTAHVTTPSGRVIGIPVGTRLVFGRGPDADLVIPAGRGLSRRAGAISAAADGAWVANISYTHALYAEGDGYRIRLPRMDGPGEPSAGWFVREGTALIGSRAMLDEGQPLRLAVTLRAAARRDAGRADDRGADGDPTLLPLYLDPNTKLFLLALMWCRPWLIDPARRPTTWPASRTRLGSAGSRANGSAGRPEWPWGCWPPCRARCRQIRCLAMAAHNLPASEPASGPRRRWRRGQGSTTRVLI